MTKIKMTANIKILMFVNSDLKKKNLENSSEIFFFKRGSCHLGVGERPCRESIRKGQQSCQ